MRIVIAGSRGFADYERLAYVMDKLTVNQSDVTVISGTATGADTLGERWAQERGHDVIRMPADWATYGRFAGPRRNADMADVADAVVCFWDGVSRGTKNMIDEAERRGLALRVIRT